MHNKCIFVTTMWPKCGRRLTRLPIKFHFAIVIQCKLKPVSWKASPWWGFCNVLYHKGFNSLKPIEVPFKPWSTLVKTMACRLFGAKPLLKPTEAYCSSIMPKQQTLVQFQSKFDHIILENNFNVPSAQLLPLYWSSNMPMKGKIYYL